jgi:hypothetical protein
MVGAEAVERGDIEILIVVYEAEAAAFAAFLGRGLLPRDDHCACPDGLASIGFHASTPKPPLDACGRIPITRITGREV